MIRWLAVTLAALGLLGVVLSGCYAHTPAPSCAAAPGGLGCLSPITDTTRPRDGGTR